VSGNTQFAGQDETGLLTAGVLDLKGNFTQTAGPSVNAFVASGTQRTRFTGSGVQNIIFVHPANSHFQELDLANSGGITLGSAVLIPGTVALTTPVSVTGGSLTAGVVTTVAGSTLGVGTLTMSSDQLTVGGGYTVASTIFTGGSGVPVLPYQDLLLSSPTPMTLAGATTLSGNFTIDEGTLILGGKVLTVAGTFNVSSQGTLTMTNGADQVVVSGNTQFAGQDETGLLTAGVLDLKGNFTQTAGPSVNAFVASGTQRTRFTGSGVQNIIFVHPANSHFQELDVSSATGGLTLGSSIFVNDSLISRPAAGSPTITNGVITASRLAVNGLKLNNSPLIWIEPSGGIVQFDNVQFAGFPGTVTQLKVTAFGGAAAPRTVTFNNLIFTHITAAPGLYVNLTSANGFGINLHMAGSSELPSAGGNGPTFSNPPNQQSLGGATILWP
jgi:hypothetical protein